MSTKRSPAERTLETELFGRDVTFDYSETWVGYSVLGLRLVMAWVFLQAGVEKLLDPEWSAAGYIDPQSGFGVTEANPFADLFASMVGSVGAVDPLVVYGQLAIGLALLLGVLVRFAAFWGVVQLVLFWMASLQGGLTEGFPVEHGYVVNSDVVYVLLLFGLAAVGAGRILGLDARIEETELVRNNPSLKYLLG